MKKKLIKQAPKKRKRAGRVHTLLEAADLLGVAYTTVRNWSQREDAPLDRDPKTKRLRCAPAELSRWAEACGLTGKVGRPKNALDEVAGDRGIEHWRTRHWRIKTLAAEGAVIAKTTHLQLLAALSNTAANKLRGLPAAAAPAAFGKTVPEIEATLQRFVDDICDQLSDPANYQLPSGDAEDLVPGMEAARSSEAE